MSDLSTKIWTLRAARERITGTLYPAVCGGGVVSTEKPAGMLRGGDDVDYYGGYLLGEGMTHAAIEFMCRTHAALPEILDELERLQKRFETFYQLAIENKQGSAS